MFVSFRMKQVIFDPKYGYYIEQRNGQRMKLSENNTYYEGPRGGIYFIYKDGEKAYIPGEYRKSVIEKFGIKNKN